ncbi:MAG: ABC transporter substrate-binding protein [Eubacteriales bacterium]|nr:ABC transporter substrate-binding protein [Eubacteriales bacterium]
MKVLKKLSVSAVILIIAALTACGNQPGQETAPAPAEKSETLTVAAVSRSIGDLWLLSGGELSGITEDGMYLEGISENTRVIGTVTNPSLEAIAALSPDMVLLSGELPTHKKLAEDLESRGISSRMISVNSFSEYDQVMKEFTGMTGREDCYRKNVTDVRERIDQILQSASEKGSKKGTYLALRVSATKNKTLKNDYFACEIFNAFGLENIAQDNSVFDELNLEAILDADPDFIFVIEQGNSAEAQDSFTEAFSGKRVWQELAAVRNGCVYILPKDYFQYKPNAKWDEAYQYVMELLAE